MPANLRHHVRRAVIRVSALLVVDALTFGVARGALHLLRGARWLGGTAHGAVSAIFADGYSGAMQYAAALLIGLTALHCYGRGDRWRNSSSIYRATALATALALWPRLWATWDVAVVVQFFITLAAFGTALVVARLALDLFVEPYFRTPVLARTLLVGPGERCQEVWNRRASYRRAGLHVLGFLDTTGKLPKSRGSLEHLEAVLESDYIDTVLLCGSLNEEAFGVVVRASTAVECHLIAEMRSMATAGIQPSILWHRGESFVELRAPVLRAQQRFIKRTMDILLSAAALVVLSPLLLLIAGAVALESPGSVMFGQKRPGFRGHWFRMLKFRTMRSDAEAVLRADPELFGRFLAEDCKLPDELDPRITRVGRLLRRTSLDELPQFFNVLRGDMSLVGPRPVVGPELRHYGAWTDAILRAKPGITGWWQVKGRSNVKFPERANLDIYYVANWSIGLDLRILFMTIPAVLKRHGAF